MFDKLRYKELISDHLMGEITQEELEKRIGKLNTHKKYMQEYLKIRLIKQTLKNDLLPLPKALDTLKILRDNNLIP